MPFFWQSLLCILRMEHNPCTSPNIEHDYLIKSMPTCEMTCKLRANLFAGQHGFNGYVPGTMALTAGLHTIEIDYYQVRQKGNEGLPGCIYVHLL